MINNNEMGSMIARETGYYRIHVFEVLKKLDEILVRELISKPEKIRLGSFEFESKIVEEREIQNVAEGKIQIKPRHLKCNARLCPTLKRRFYKTDLKGETDEQ